MKKKVLCTSVILLFIYLLLTATLEAVPVKVIVEGQLEAANDDYCNLDGAMIEVTYVADSTVPPAAIHSYSEVTFSIFDVLATCNITNRPSGTEALLNLTYVTDLDADNWFSPNLSNDAFEFNDCHWTIIEEEDIFLYVSVWKVDCGSQEFFSGTSAVDDLSFLFDLEQPWSIDYFPVVNVQNSGHTMEWGYSMNNVSITFIPEPTTISLLALGAILAGRKKRMVYHIE